MRFPLALLFAMIALGLAAETGNIQRFALVAGSNVGGKTTATLKYATNDAKRVRDLLVRIGGTKEENVMLLINPEKDSMMNGLAYIGNKIRKARSPEGKTQLVFYYSGHSDERGLLLSGEYFSYKELKAALDSVVADVRVVVLDSCSSGAFTREKGGSIGSPFLVDESASVEGHAYITSSTAEEASQESDKIESSFFTHYFLNGLRGAADVDGDGLVSLNEAYDYAYQGTLAETERTRSGAQHPAFDIKLNGMGDLVLTDLREGEALLKLSKDLSGRLSLRDVSNKLVAEVAKRAGKEMAIGLEQGYYRLLLEEGKQLSEAVLIVDEKREYEVKRDVFRGIAASVNAERGPERNPISLQPLGLRVSTSGGGTSLYLSPLGGTVASVDGVMASLVYNRTSGSSTGYQGAVFANSSAGDFTGMQGSFGANFVQGDLFGVQSAILLNETGGNLKGVQVSLYNHVSGNAKIGQLGAFNTVAGEGDYFQLGAYNRSLTAIRGAQGGALNIAKVVTGLQVGLVNYSEEQTGVQVGIVNVSRRLDGLPIGLIDIQFNGENHIDVVASSVADRFDDLDDSLLTSTYLRFGSKYFYKYFDFGWFGVKGDSAEGYPAFVAGAGLGFRIPMLFEGFAFHVDGGVNYHSMIQRVEIVEDPDFFHKIVPQFRLFSSVKIFRNMGLVAGFEQWVYTKHFHQVPESAGAFDILTGYGVLVVDARFFLGVQL